MHSFLYFCIHDSYIVASESPLNVRIWVFFENIVGVLFVAYIFSWNAPDSFSSFSVANSSLNGVSNIRVGLTFFLDLNEFLAEFYTRWELGRLNGPLK